MNDRDVAALAAAVQHNCDLADARYAGDLSLCTYLLEMRELFRWQRALPLPETPARADVGAWIASREASWQVLADEPDADYVPLPLAPSTLVSDREHARGLNPPPAAMRGNLVFVRRDVLRRSLWTRMETASRRTVGDTFGAAFAAYATNAGLTPIRRRHSSG